MSETTTTERRVRQPVKRRGIELAVLAWLAKQTNQSSRVTNQRIAASLDLPLDEGRIQNRRLSEALSSLRNQGLIAVSREHPHPLLSPAGRSIALTDDGRAELAEEVAS
jgi:DNA-binding PadR family transcriptional regulator